MTLPTATDEDKLKALAMLESLPSRKSNSVEADEAGYAIALEGTFRDGLFAAVRSILKGSLGHAFYPSPPELRQQHDAEMQGHWAREARQRRFLEHDIDPAWRPPTSAEKTRVAKMVADFHANLPAKEEGPGFDWERVHARFDSERVIK